MDPESARAPLTQVVERFERAIGEAAPLRDVIFDSWRRCVLDGLTAEHWRVPYAPDIDAESRLAWAAATVFNRVADDLRDTPIALILTDQRGHVLVRRDGTPSVARLMDHIELAPGFVYGEDLVGTNAIGTALELRAPAVVLGYEHFANALTSMACAASPVADPASGRIIGVVDLTCAADQAAPLMLPLAKRIAWEIEQRLLDDASVDERILRERFLTARRAIRGPLVSINQSSLLVSAAAAAVVQPSDRELLWDWAAREINLGARGWSTLQLSSGRSVTLRCQPVRDGSRVVGAIIHLDPGLSASSTDPATEATSIGLAKRRLNLTSTERAVADLVARGLTNSEIAANLVLSPHTIDYHLRQIFRKVNVRSRVELTRAVVEFGAGF